MRNPVRLAVVVSHPIQHFAPFYRAMAEHEAIDLVVVFASRIGIEPYFDEGMQTTISWNMDLVGGYEHIFLPEADQIKSASSLEVNNPSIAEELARQAPDVVLIYGYNQLTSLRALWWCRRNGVPAMMISDSELKAPRTTLAKLAKRFSIPALLKQFSAFLTVGDCNEEYYRSYGISDERMFRSPFTIDEQTYRNARRDRKFLRAQVRRQLGLGDDEVVSLTVGKLSERKRARDVIEVARRMKSQEPRAKVTFLLAGNGELMEELLKAVEAESLPVHLLGFINVDELPPYYAAADFILHPSGHDPHPLVMSEAACVGLPLVISDRVGAAGPTDIAQPGKNAIVFPCGNVDAITEAVATLADDADRRSEMSSRSTVLFENLDMRCSVNGAVEATMFALSGNQAA